MELADEEYKKFSSSLLPNVDNIIGVRLPELRKIARKIAKDDWRDYLLNIEQEYFEEVMLEGMVIGYIETDIKEKLIHVANFVPKINNWSVCDSFCSSLKFTHDHKEIVWEFILSFIDSKKEYDIRFAVVMMLNYYVVPDYIDRVLDILNKVKHEGYYAKMGVAWAISICYVKFPQKTGEFLKNNSLDDYTFNIALQKIVESKRIDKETKAFIRTMKRKT
ncbi:MAG TPA: DNA alkylation repair protein [Syntrophomonadaceae bacterium]|nr:DNA alkylation repair protein [Syntrophomonadaceae bacterium]